LTLDRRFQISAFSHHVMIAVKRNFARRFRLAGTLAALPCQTAGEIEGKQNGTKTTFFPSITRANFPLKKSRSLHHKKICTNPPRK
jgi:hypothetical protein